MLYPNEVCADKASRVCHNRWIIDTIIENHTVQDLARSESFDRTSSKINLVEGGGGAQKEDKAP